MTRNDMKAHLAFMSKKLKYDENGSKEVIIGEMLKLDYDEIIRNWRRNLYEMDGLSRWGVGIEVKWIFIVFFFFFL